MGVFALEAPVELGNYRMKITIMRHFAGLLCLLMMVSGCSKPKVNEFLPPEKTGWAPEGVRMAGNFSYGVIPEDIGFKTMHGGINNTDNVWIAAAPMFTLDWVAEPALYVPEGPTYDKQGNLYFSPLNPAEDVSLISLDGNTGERRWSIVGEGRNAGSGAILVLNDPDSSDNDIIYHATYLHAMAITTDGEVLWKTPTGLSFDDIATGGNDNSHSFGMNYHPTTDSVIGVTSDGHVFAMDRKTGVSRNALLKLPGAPSPVSAERPANWVIKRGDSATDEAFGKLPDGRSIFTALVDTIYGGDAQVTNYYGVDPNTGKIYIAATAPDSDDGVEDGVSGFGALYLLDLKNSNGQYVFEIEAYRSFEGGTGSTPSISADSSRVIVSDSANNIIAFDAQLNELWRLNVGDQLAASVAISADNHELYAVTKNDIFKVKDYTTHAEIEWRANLDAWASEVEFNALTPTITANGIVVSVGTGYVIQGQQLMLAVGMGLLDRETGNLRYFAEGREESIAVSSVSPDGSIYMAHSPVRRAVGRSLLPKITAPLIGGISRFKPIRLDLLVRDASCAAEARLQNMLPWYLEQPNAAADDLRQITALIHQANTAVQTAVSNGDLSVVRGEQLTVALSEARSNLDQTELDAAHQQLSTACALFQ